jgi:hypothetical protein
MTGNAMTNPGSTTARGYGATHQTARRLALTHHHPSHPCPRCGLPLGPAYGWRYVKTRRTVAYGSLLDYDHNGARTGYLGLSHANQCNRSAGARKGNTPRRRRVVTSRSW